LNSFSIDLTALHQIPVHPAIAKDKVLADYIPEERLQAWEQNCRLAHGKIFIFFFLCLKI